jgi:hypothetical protein
MNQITQNGVLEMVAYEFYWRNKSEGDKLIGILPERRKNPERISHESVMKWVRMVLGDLADKNNVYFIEVEVRKQDF